MTRAAKRGPKPWEPTQAERQTVELAAAIGYTQEEIGAVLGKSVESLARHCREELDRGALKINARVAGKLLHKALSGDTASLIFWAKTRLGWRETNKTELAGSIEVKDGRTPEEVRQAIMGKLAVIAEASGTGEIPEKSDAGGA